MLNKIQPSPVPQCGLERCHGSFRIKKGSLCWQTTINQLFFSYDQDGNRSTTKLISSVKQRYWRHFPCFLWPCKKRKNGSGWGQQLITSLVNRKRQCLYIYHNLPARGRSDRSACLAMPLLAGLALLYTECLCETKVQKVTEEVLAIMLK